MNRLRQNNRNIFIGMKFYLVLVLSLGMIGCGSDGSDGAVGATGATGPTGPTGETGSSSVEYSPTSLAVTVDSVVISSPPVVNFNVVDQDGVAYTDLSGPRFMLSKLVPGSNGDASAWQSYINRTEVANGTGPGTVDMIQATQDRNGTLVNNGDGSYTYTFEADVTNITTPLAVGYEPSLTHRLAIQISGSGQPASNGIYTWRPSDGATTGLASRDIVKTETCNACHGKLAIHGGGRIEAQLCVTCHNEGSVDANSGNTVDFSVMVHKIHSGASLPSVVAGGEYSIWGYRDGKHDYSEVDLPMDIRNCTSCHDETDTDTPDAINWQDVPTIEACGSCHDDIDFSLGIGTPGSHSGGVMVDNSGCTICHTEGGFAGTVAESHVIDTQEASDAFQFNILDITNTAPGQFPAVTLSVTNPQAGDSTYDILADPEFTAGGGASRVAVDIAWNAENYSNDGTGSGVSSAVSINPLSSAVDNLDGTFTVTSTVAIPATQTGSGAVAIEGHPAIDVDGDGTYSDRVPVTGTVDYFAITDSAPVSRRAVVSIEKCQSCHVNLNIHGSNRNDNIELCAMCHNPSNTDLNRRPAMPADGLTERSVDLAYMIHAIHASEMREDSYIAYGFGGSEHDFSEVDYPGVLSDCETCHLSGTYELPLFDGAQGTTIDSGADSLDRADDLKITPTAAACSACHDDPLSQAHMVQNGGASFSTSQQSIDDFDVIETCVFCHGQDTIADVKEEHGVQ